MNQFVNLDAAETIFFTRELEHRKAKSYDILRAPLTAFELIPVSTEISSGAETMAYEQYDMTGVARIIANYADDLPRADVKAKEFISKIKSIGASFGYSLQEVRAAMMAGKPLVQRKANAAVRTHRELWNRIAFYGDSVNELPGLLTNPNIPSSAALTKEAVVKWTAKLGLASGLGGRYILDDLNMLANTMVGATNGVEKPDTIALPIDEYSLIASTPWNVGGTDTTILSFFLANNPYIKSVVSLNEITKAQMNANGLTTFNGGVAMAYRKSSDVLEFQMPQFYETLPVQERNLEFVTPCHSRVGGTTVYYPFAIRFMDGFTSDAT